MQPDKLLRVAKWEVTKNAGGVDKRTVVVMALALVAMGAVAAIAVSGGTGAGMDDGIYRIGVDESSPYHGVAADDRTFDIREPDPAAVERRQQELLYRGIRLQNEPRTAKERAALTELRDSTAQYNDRTLARDDNQTAAFPVSVTLVYEQQSGSSRLDPRSGDSSDESDTSDSGTSASDMGEQSTSSGGGSDESSDETSDASSEGGAGSGDSSATSDGGEGGVGDSGDSAGGEERIGSSDGATSSSGANLGAVGARLTGDVQGGTPSDISPPFPFESLVLAFLYIVPMNFVIQAYGSSMLSERLNRRGELLLVTPASRGDIIGGKTLPYFLGAVGVAALITAALRVGNIAPAGSLVAVLAVVPLVVLFLSATFCGAMFARSFKELTFVTVTITVTLTSYAFVPAIFTDVTPIALISPLTLVVLDLTGQSVGLSSFVFSATPPLLTGLVLFGLGAGLYREEDMFTQRPIPLKVLDALAGGIRTRRSALKMSVVLLPLVIVAELAAVAFLFVLDSVSLNVFGTNQSLGIVLVLVVIVVIEELAKSLHVYAGYEHARYERTLRSALGVGALSGLGFFIGEKGLLIARLSDLESLPIGEAALQGATLPAGLPLWVAGLLFLLPLALHTVTAAISSVGASRGRRAYLGGLGLAIVVHFAYNFAVVSTLV
ncbi:PrsW family intramembrane metalloprotease [Haloarcula sp. 1CSR25-25]|uniref:PrsW family intramembrane metalloprotease n=1 Tax=Haloarcula sp. 1CSR25-25 TaxID=2862545 RepID=UPI002894E31A|nr:PrsW family intramembrane metalloprotease [Haloarcula sp. 1CSR25-25]MDT3434997.1 PrsW family intramembrane metalloprotease [Haloarcula sp. 1CSR25-25]